MLSRRATVSAMLAVAAAAVTILGTGCGGGGGNNSATGVPEAWRTCNRAAECEVVARDCCPDCRTERVAVRFDRAGKARRRLGTSRCGGDCPATRCSTKWLAVCESGTCRVRSRSACATLDRSSCEDREDCSPLKATPRSEACPDGDPSAAPTYVGCRSSDQLCGSSDTCGFDPETDERFLFPTDCLPRSWQTCGGPICD